ncbi:type IV pilus modification protein PilV [Tahibacter harae]|uniref:Type IV pilus modification protein PilV n=1 Tax=Tahibacter harae TaxID=2963937 RepID=A0ABT1QMM1_9GAMM|nr:type IV pilus modification protein PilV [Tahibacter harae]MCQ4163779.1 type IV pilus modification protein PilV [Tahibacter harae]
MTRSKNRGFSLLEVLIALMIFSVGLLGLAGLMVVSVKTNNGAYQRTQAAFLAQSMVDRMRANSMGVWGGNYNATVPGGSNPTCPCTVAQLAQRDLYWWGQELTNFLPNPAATVRCVNNNNVGVNDRRRPPYNGTCTMTITWTEGSLDRAATGPGSQTFTWVFQP